jgi:hypothetical protein
VDEQCDAAGHCVGAPDLATNCSVADRSLLQIDDVDGGSRDHLRWSWTRRETADPVLFGNPGSSTDYDLCVFDFLGGVPRVALSTHVQAGTNWLQRSQGWSYVDGAAFQDGVQKLSLVSGGASRLNLKARGQRLGLPGPVGAKYFDQDPYVVAQLRNDGGQCWTSTIHQAAVSSPAKFLGKTP